MPLAPWAGAAKKPQKPLFAPIKRSWRVQERSLPPLSLTRELVLAHLRFRNKYHDSGAVFFVDMLFQRLDERIAVPIHFLHNIRLQAQTRECGLKLIWGFAIVPRCDERLGYRPRLF